MEVHEVSLSELFLNNKKYKNKRFVVPPFQRRYAWKLREFERLWEDICNVLKNERNRHFMGTVVLEPSFNARSSKQRLLVIDGQQRLATFTVLFAAIETIAKRSNIKFDDVSELLRDVDDVNRFEPSLPDQEAIRRLIADPSSLRITKERNIKTGFDYFEEQIKNWVGNPSGGTNKVLIKKLKDTILNKLFFIQIILNEKDDAQSIFETINYIGVPLSAADLARNFVLGLAGGTGSQQELNEKYWRPIESCIEDSIPIDNKKAKSAQFQKVLPEFLRAVLTAEQRSYVNFSDLYGRLRKFYAKDQLTQNLGRTLEHVKNFGCFLDPSRMPKKVQLQLERFKLLRMTTHYPLLLLLFEARDKKRLTDTQLVSAMRGIESFVVRRAFNSKVSRDLNKVFAAVAGKFPPRVRNKGLLKAIHEELKKHKWPTDDEFKNNFLSSPIYANGPAIARFVLEAIEEEKSGANELRTDKKIQVEHIFPQGAKDGWQGPDLQGLKTRLHHIGNLSLTGFNQKLGRQAFNEKKKVYRTSKFWLNKITAKHTTWNEAAINKRAQVLLKVALKIWPGPN